MCSLKLRCKTLFVLTLPQSRACVHTPVINWQHLSATPGNHWNDNGGKLSKCTQPTNGRWKKLLSWFRGSSLLRALGPPRLPLQPQQGRLAGTAAGTATAKASTSDAVAGPRPSWSHYTGHRHCTQCSKTSTWYALPPTWTHKIDSALCSTPQTLPKTKKSSRGQNFRH